MFDLKYVFRKPHYYYALMCYFIEDVSYFCLCFQ
jgi:hypothetical protein